MRWTEVSCRIAVVIAVAAANAGATWAQSYPTRPVRFVAPTTPGGGHDTVGRLVAQPLTQAHHRAGALTRRQRRRERWVGRARSVGGVQRVEDRVREQRRRRVSQIVTFNKMNAKSAVRDVGRVIGLSYGEADRIAKMIPNELNITLASAAEKTPDLKKARPYCFRDVAAGGFGPVAGLRT